MTRSAGILLHPTSLPGSLADRRLGSAAERFLDWAASAGQTLWQVLPLGPTGAGNSPYTSASAFAGNPLLISPERLVEDGLLAPDALADAPLAGGARGLRRGPRLEGAPPARARGARFSETRAAHARCARRCSRSCAPRRRRPGSRTGRASRRSRRASAGDPGPTGGRTSRSASRTRSRRPTPSSPGEIAFHRFVQFQFHPTVGRASAARRDDSGHRARRRHPDLRRARQRRRLGATRSSSSSTGPGVPTDVAGVPPDYFSATGQLWGNPLYRWDRLRGQTATPGGSRASARASRAGDLLRIDHFRAFESYWSIPAGEKTALGGPLGSGTGAARSSTRHARRSVTCPSSPRTSATSRRRCGRCSTSSASRG